MRWARATSAKNVANRPNDNVNQSHPPFLACDSLLGRCRFSASTVKSFPRQLGVASRMDLHGVQRC
jgi:hypothetical protein